MSISRGGRVSRPEPGDASRASGAAGRAPSISTALVLTLALQSAVPPFATDTYTPAFPQVTSELSTSAALVGLTLTSFFLGLGAGQLLGGPLSDQTGRRRPLIVGGIVCMIGAVGCALAPSIDVLIAMRLIQGIGGGIAASVARAIVIDVARGDLMAKMMSILMALGGLAPAIAPVVGGLVLTFGGTWRVIFWLLVVFGALMVVTAALFVPETLPPQRRHRGGVMAVLRGFRSVMRVPRFVGFMLVAAFSGFAMLAYIANAAYMLQGMKGMPPLPFSLFFAATALGQMGVSVLNARLIGRYRPQQLIAAGLGASAAATLVIAAAVAWGDSALVPVCVGFFVIMSAQGLIFGNAGALASGEVVEHAGAASGLQGVALALALAVSAPLASSGGSETAVPMVITMGVGVAIAVTSFLWARRARGAAG